MEESPGHVWGMVCHPCGWNPRLAVEELLKIKAGRWVGSNCKWLTKEFGRIWEHQRNRLVLKQGPCDHP